MRRKGSGIAVCAAITALAMSVAACGGSSGDGGSEAQGKQSEAGGVMDALNETSTLDAELRTAVNRLVVDCMEDKSFDVHPLWLTTPVEAESENGAVSVTGSLLQGNPPEFHDVPTVKDAKKWGYTDPMFRGTDGEDAAGMDGGEEEDPYHEESGKYQDDYQKAQYGDEYAKWMSGKESEGNDPLGPAPLEGGCTGEVYKAVYGEPITPDAEDSEEDGEAPYYGIEFPEDVEDLEKELALYETPKLLDARDDLSKCIQDKDYPYFEYSEGGMGMSTYVDWFYESNMAKLNSSENDTPKPDLPKGAPWKDDDKAFEAEVAFATVVAECADDTGFRKTMKTEWSNALEQVALDNEKVLFAWHDDLKAALERAQDLIEK